MKLFSRSACLPAGPVIALALLLAGCATTGTPPAPVTGAGGSAVITAPPAPSAQAPAQRSLQPAQIPSGPLQPVVAVEPAVAPAVATLTPPADLWDRMRRGFVMPDLDDSLVLPHTQWYARRPDHIQRVTERSRKYLFHIVEELERRGMPSELALLPFIESAFNPQAVSHAKAAGMWQFIPSTGKIFDLKQNAFRDDRRDVLASTRAALDYLQKLHGMFSDWHLALAAYNCGEGCVGRAIERNRRAGKGTRYEDLNLPNETRGYVPRFLAVRNLVRDPQTMGVELPLIENHPYFQTVDIARDIDVDLAARLADMRVEDFRALNPSAKGPVVLAAGTPQILLPWDNATIFQRNLDGYSKGQYSSWTAWISPARMTPAEAARRVGMSEAELRQVNAIPQRKAIQAGATLIVRRAAGRAYQDVDAAVADNGQLLLAPDIQTRRIVVKAGKADSVASIARRYRLNAVHVAEWNNVGVSTAFRAGQSVVVYLPVRPKAAATSGKGAGKKPAPPQRRGGQVSKKPRR